MTLDLTSSETLLLGVAVFVAGVILLCGTLAWLAIGRRYRKRRQERELPQ
jgi:hypothetical protein